MKLVVWLGNPGQKYRDTRHNIGFFALDAWVEAERLGQFSYVNKFSSELLESHMRGEKIILLKPMLFMNKSGFPLHQVMQFYKVASEDILVIHDEIDHELWSVKLKIWGGHAGHNGLRDIIWYIGKDFARVRVWVGRPVNKEDVSDYVLWHFSKIEKKIVNDLLPVIFDIIEKWTLE